MMPRLAASAIWDQPMERARARMRANSTCSRARALSAAGRHAISADAHSCNSSTPT